MSPKLQPVATATCCFVVADLHFDNNVICWGDLGSPGASHVRSGMRIIWGGRSPGWEAALADLESIQRQRKEGWRVMRGKLSKGLLWSHSGF